MRAAGAIFFFLILRAKGVKFFLIFSVPQARCRRDLQARFYSASCRRDFFFILRVKGVKKVFDILRAKGVKNIFDTLRAAGAKCLFVILRAKGVKKVFDILRAAGAKFFSVILRANSLSQQGCPRHSPLLEFLPPAVVKGSKCKSEGQLWGLLQKYRSGVCQTFERARDDIRMPIMETREGLSRSPVLRVVEGSCAVERCGGSRNTMAQT